MIKYNKSMDNEIITRFNAGESKMSIAKNLGINKRTIMRVIDENKKNVSELLSNKDVISNLKKLESDTVLNTKQKLEKINDLQSFLDARGITVKDLEKLLYHKEVSGGETFEIQGTDEVFKIGVVSDTHLGAKTCAIDELKDFYHIMHEEGVTDVLHSGDLTDGGGKVYPGQLDELKVYGIDDMKEYVAEYYPQEEGITTHFIGGNHDEDFKKHGGADIGKAISELRKDLNYLGWYHANIIINGIKTGLHHGGGGLSYAISYKMQKAVENLTGDNKPQCYFLGHYHGSLYMAHRNIHCVMPGCFQKANNLSRRFNLPQNVGGYIIEISKTYDNSIRSFKPSFTQYYF